MREGSLPDAKLYSGKVKRLALSMIKRGYTLREAMDFVSSAKGILDKDNYALMNWFTENLPALENRENFKELREDCACCLGGKREAAARAIFKENPDRASRMEALMSNPLIVGYRGEKIDENSFYVSFYPEMEYYRCSCLRPEKGKQTAPMPRGYCYCCCGHLKHHVQKALGCEVQVELITSALTTLGKEGCRFLVKVVKEED